MSRVIAEEQTPGRRRRSEAKRAAILDAAEARFLADGYEQASVDAIAAQAGVSKRTMYDHFGEKGAIYLRAVERVHALLVAAAGAAIDEELSAGRNLREGLEAFARRIITDTFPSSSYVTFRRLTAERAAPRLGLTTNDRPERMLADRFAQLAEEGTLRTDAPELAARHFSALTVELALHALDSGANETEILYLVDSGVAAFLRAYS
ncbi:TetR/AcrR family transcriptional regulator [Microbacterium halotolerans]|uniref:TetR/AcrR family transcriptional regulator n=1 Tax=Microbacterium halotolerans TaxID=246613 RepID=UPI000E6AACFC|nr:TetR/AcrR family transcriptional regulator [Microbacterium halotolerans]